MKHLAIGIGFPAAVVLLTLSVMACVGIGCQHWSLFWLIIAIPGGLALVALFLIVYFLLVDSVVKDIESSMSRRNK